VFSSLQINKYQALKAVDAKTNKGHLGVISVVPNIVMINLLG